MCGIIGAVGRPKSSIHAYSLITNLLRETQRRGRHATGFFSVGVDGKTDWHKSPETSSLFVKSLDWKRTIKGMKVLIGHCRYSTGAPASQNQNNHPFVSKNGNLGLVHNGIISDYDTYKDQYKSSLESECDSEIVLRMICREKNPVEGIKKVFELLGPAGDFACELIKVRPDTGDAWMYFFRDEGRPGMIVDAREETGQIYFCSEIAIWRDACKKASVSKKIADLTPKEVDPYKILLINADNLKIIEIPVKKPTRVYRARKTYASSSTTGRYWDPLSGTWKDTLGSGTTHYSSGNYSTKNSTVQESRGIEPPNESTTSVLNQSFWTESVNEKQLPKFTYDPSKPPSNLPVLSTAKRATEFLLTGKISEIPSDADLNRESLLLLLRKAKEDSAFQYIGWEEEALRLGILSEEEFLQMKHDPSSGQDFAIVLEEE